MVYAHRVTRVTISGTMFGGNEQWSTGFWFGQEGADAANWSQLAVNDVLAAWTTFFEAPNSYISSSYVTTQVKAAAISREENTDDANVYYANPGGVVDGGATSAFLPPQCTLAATLLSDRPRGKASKGRMYLPGIAVNVQAATGKIINTQVATIADNLKTFFDALANSANIPDELILVARGTGLFPDLNAQNDYVETIRVGDVVDTQRRRRNNLVETYTSRVLV